MTQAAKQNWSVSRCSVATPAIARDLNTTVADVQGVVSLYSMVMASLMLTGGKLGAILGVAQTASLPAVAGTILLSLLATSCLSRRKLESEAEPITRNPGAVGESPSLRYAAGGDVTFSVGKEEGHGRSAR